VKKSFILSIIIHAVAGCVLLLFITRYRETPTPVDPSPQELDPAPITEVSDEQLEQLDAAIEGLEQQQKPHATQANNSSPGTLDHAANEEPSLPRSVPSSAVAAQASATTPTASTDAVSNASPPPKPSTAFHKTEYASAGPLSVPADIAAGTSLPRVAVADPSAAINRLPTGESSNVGGFRAPRALFSNVRQADIAALLAARQAVVLIDLPDKTSYLFDARTVVLCTSRDQFLVLADRAISFPTDSGIATSLLRDAARPLKAQEGVDSKQLANATLTLVWTNPLDAAILQSQQDATATLRIPFEQVAATRGSIELSEGRFSRYRISQIQLTDDRLVPVKE